MDLYVEDQKNSLSLPWVQLVDDILFYLLWFENKVSMYFPQQLKSMFSNNVDEIHKIERFISFSNLQQYNRALD